MDTERRAMTDQVMSHEQAVKGMAVERYLLGEMNEAEQAAFEEHYLNCAACLESVTFAGEIMQAAAPLARERKAAEQRSTAPARWRGGFLSLAWAPSFAMALVVCLTGLSVYQATVIHGQKETLAKAQAPAQEFGHVLSGQSRGAANVITVKRGGRISLRIELTPKPQLKNYRAIIVTSSNVVKYTVPLQVSAQEDFVTLSVPADNLGSGSYEFLVNAEDAVGNQEQVADGKFELQLVD